ncbi:MAG: RNA polymerase sigma factor [Myxococcota bacterium]
MVTVVSLSERRRAHAEASEAELVRAVVEKDDSRAKEDLYVRLGPMVMRLAHRLLGGQEVDDVVQDTFVAAFEQLSKLRDPAHIRPWIRSITVNKVRRTIRRRVLRRRLGFSEEPIDVEAMIGNNASPEIGAELRQLYGILQTLPTDVRIALVLRRVEERTIDEIAKTTRVSASTVKRRLRQGELRLSKAMQENLP